MEKPKSSGSKSRPSKSTPPATAKPKAAAPVKAAAKPPQAPPARPAPLQSPTPAAPSAAPVQPPAPAGVKSTSKPAAPAPPAKPSSSPASAKGSPATPPPAKSAGNPKGGKATSASPPPASSASGKPSPTPAATPRSPGAPPSTPPTPPPPILLEGDATRPQPVGGPGHRYVLGPAGDEGARRPAERGELPAAYGTRKLLLVARDPHWLYAHWDLTDAQLRDYNRQAAKGHLAIRIYAGSSPEGQPLVEQDVHPESRNWFLHVPSAGARYVGELGFVSRDRAWNRISVSAATLTPAEDLSGETWVRFETLPIDIPMATLVGIVRQAVADHVPLIEAIQQLRAQGFSQLPPVADIAASTWTAEQQEALARIISMDEVRRVWIGSLEITEWIRRQLMRGISSGELPISSLGQALGISSISSVSSPFGAEAAPRRGFWFNVNAELIVYGATDPRATVRIGDRTIQLRPDGTFSYRFALPDGTYQLPIQATAPDGLERRNATLDFARHSAYRGDVGTHPQDPALRIPSPAHVA